jgi:uroporphyrinogen-III decarboxylase
MKEYVDMQNRLMQQVIDAKTEGMMRYTDGQIAAQAQAVTKADAAMEKRLDGINEFRGQLKDQAGTFITRQELFAWCFAIIGAVFAFMGYNAKKMEQQSKYREGGTQDTIKKST